MKCPVSERLFSADTFLCSHLRRLSEDGSLPVMEEQSDRVTLPAEEVTFLSLRADVTLAR